MKEKLEYQNHLSIDFLPSRTNWHSKSQSNIFPLSPLNQSNSNQHQHYNCFNYENINLSVKRTRVMKLKRDHFNRKLLRKEAIQKSLDSFHKSFLKEKLDRNYSSLFLTKTQDMSMPLLSPLPQAAKIDLPKTGLSNYRVYPIETAKAFTQRCCDIARVVYLTKEHKAALKSLEEEENTKIDSLIEQRRTYITSFNASYFVFRTFFNSYLKFLRQKAEKETDRLEELHIGIMTRMRDIRHLTEVIQKKKEISTSMNLIKGLLTCAKEAITVNSSKSLSDGNHSHTQALFKEYYKLKEYTHSSKVTDLPDSLTKGFFLKALNRLRMNKSLNDYYSSKYSLNPFLFDSYEDFFEHVTAYENKILTLIGEYDKKKSSNEELSKQLNYITLFCNNNIAFEDNIFIEKEKERDAAIEKHKALTLRKEQILRQKFIKIKRKEFKVPSNPSYLTANQSDEIVLAFKYNSLSREYPFPFTCVYAKLLEIIQGIEVHGPKFVCFDTTTAFCTFDMKDLHELYKMKFNSKNEDEVTEKILILLRIVERSFKEILLSLRRIRENKVINAQMTRLLDSFEKDKKIKGMTYQREVVDTIRKLIMRSVDEKSHKFALKQKKKVNLYFYLKENSKKKKNAFDKKSFEEGIDLKDFLHDIIINKE